MERVERKKGYEEKGELLTPVNFDVDVLDLKDARLVVRLLVREDEGDGGAETFTSEDDIGETRILHLGETSLLAVIEGDVPHVGLDLREGEGDLVMLVVCKIP